MHLISPSEKTTQAICHAVRVSSTEWGEKMLTKALFLTGGEADTSAC
jgi:hypothetical protein